MSLLKYAYLLDQDNYCIENKVFIDLMWHITKNKGINTKSYVIRNAGIMFQQIFYWHFHYIKKGISTKYQYNKNGVMVNVIKKDFADWWEDLRITNREVTTANKLLIDTGLIDIHIMRIKTDETTFKPSNCYELITETVEAHLDKLIEISKDLYEKKVNKVRKHNSNADKRKKIVPTETVSTLKPEGLNTINIELSTQLTLSTDKKNTVPTETDGTKEPTETDGAKEPTETDGAKEPTETGCTNKSETTYRNYIQKSQNRNEGSLSFESDWEKAKHILRRSLSANSFKTWIESSIEKVDIDNNDINIYSINEFSRQILEERYSEMIKEAFRIISGEDLSIKFYS